MRTPTRTLMTSERLTCAMWPRHCLGLTLSLCISRQWMNVCRCSSLVSVVSRSDDVEIIWTISSLLFSSSSLGKLNDADHVDGLRPHCSSPLVSLSLRRSTSSDILAESFHRQIFVFSPKIALILSIVWRGDWRDLRKNDEEENG